jgi:hypothetical protein
MKRILHIFMEGNRFVVQLKHLNHWNGYSNFSAWFMKNMSYLKRGEKNKIMK